MQTINKIKAAVKNTQHVYSLHAVDQSILRRIKRQELEEALISGEIIENYPDDKYGPSCLIYGKTQKGRPLHIVCTVPGRGKPGVKIITIYEPDSNEWINFKQRKDK